MICEYRYERPTRNHIEIRLRWRSERVAGCTRDRTTFGARLFWGIQHYRKCSHSRPMDGALKQHRPRAESRS
ncbi:hypothetical protein MPTK1_6g15120 [Marchantia polymorpha subsp. ruderalis]|uniref:Uncharacterized protein n=2 Tax=Marchantia polymorpha TaxID=3197 RepID=A0AAF6BS78_MARPO|nr:hypothetical protein MARPO_0056s0023 [Marchantia polymorpha]BBN14862.1 hypothetical protein Mp_6g15120 [Marchantia polymorpha subsp. ruderalis]|eukprot:PTQ37544.1 hypothetical protein MARPO_0056s0023 [Marchantia polymorpha]